MCINSRVSEFLNNAAVGRTCRSSPGENDESGRKSTKPIYGALNMTPDQEGGKAPFIRQLRHMRRGMFNLIDGRLNLRILANAAPKSPLPVFRSGSALQAT